MTLRVRKTLTIFASFVALICLGSAIAYRATSDDRTTGGPLHFQPTSMIGTIRVDEHRQVEVAIENSSARPIRVVGSGDGCGLHACFTGVGMPVAIPPRGRGAIVVDFKGTSVGSISEDILVYTDADGQGTLSIKFIGEVIEPAGTSRGEPDRGLTSTALP